MPETLTADGYDDLGGRLHLQRGQGDGAGKWTVKTACVDGAEEWTDDETMELDAAGKRLTVTVDDKTTVFVRCDAGKGN